MLVAAGAHHIELRTCRALRLNVLGPDVGGGTCSVGDDLSLETAAELRHVFVVAVENGGSPAREGLDHSLLGTAGPLGGRDSINSYLARAMPARESKNSRCTGATLVTTPISGCAILARARISPAWDIPISITATSCSGSSFNSINGKPK